MLKKTVIVTGGLPFLLNSQFKNHNAKNWNVLVTGDGLNSIAGIIASPVMHNAAAPNNSL